MVPKPAGTGCRCGREGGEWGVLGTFNHGGGTNPARLGLCVYQWFSVVLKTLGCERVFCADRPVWAFQGPRRPDCGLNQHVSRLECLNGIQVAQWTYFTRLYVVSGGVFHSIRQKYYQGVPELLETVWRSGIW